MKVPDDALVMSSGVTVPAAALDVSMVLAHVITAAPRSWLTADRRVLSARMKKG